jgi:AcrR family transcriptional regulator
MARPRSDDRRAGLLSAAAEVLAEQGLAAPTSAISKRAGVSEGSFFTYFKTKDELLQALYRELRLDLAAAILDGFPRKAGVRERLEHVFTRWVSWAVENPASRRAMRQLSLSAAIPAEQRDERAALFAEVERIQLDAVAQRRLTHVPPVMAAAALKSIAEMTMDLIEQNPGQAAELRAAGFQMLWGALNTKP